MRQSYLGIETNVHTPNDVEYAATTPHGYPYQSHSLRHTAHRIALHARDSAKAQA